MKHNITNLLEYINSDISIKISKELHESDDYYIYIYNFIFNSENYFIEIMRNKYNINRIKTVVKRETFYNKKSIVVKVSLLTDNEKINNIELLLEKHLIKLK